MTSTARGAASGAAGCGSERRGPHFRPGVSGLRVGCGPRARSAALRVPRSGEWAAAGRGGRGRGSGRPAGRLGLSRLLPGWRVGPLGRRRRPPGVWTTARWTGPPWDSCEVRGPREALRRSRGVPSALRSVSCASRRGARETWCPRWPHVGGPVSVSLSAESGEPSDSCAGEAARAVSSAQNQPLRASWAQQVGRWRWRRAVRLEGPGSSETLRPRSGAAQSPEDDRLFGYPFWVGLDTSGSSVGLHTHFPEARVRAWLHTVGDIGGTAPEWGLRSWAAPSCLHRERALPNCHPPPLPPSFLFVACDIACTSRRYI